MIISQTLQRFLYDYITNTSKVRYGKKVVAKLKMQWSEENMKGTCSLGGGKGNITTCGGGGGRGGWKNITKLLSMRVRVALCYCQFVWMCGGILYPLNGGQSFPDTSSLPQLPLPLLP